VSPITLYRILQEVGQKMIDSELVPLVLTPSGDGKVEALVAALKANREWVEAKVVSNSDVLLRGFDVHGRPNKIFFCRILCDRLSSSLW
jgi:hypothetical protein